MVIDYKVKCGLGLWNQFYFSPKSVFTILIFLDSGLIVELKVIKLFNNNLFKVEQYIYFFRFVFPKFCFHFNGLIEFE